MGRDRNELGGEPYEVTVDRCPWHLCTKRSLSLSSFLKPGALCLLIEW